jgi:hypothetical protein
MVRSMGGRYRITVRGVMSERFCRGFVGMARVARADRTVLEGELASEACLAVVLDRLQNLGLDVLDVERPGGRPPDERTV